MELTDCLKVDCPWDRSFVCMALRTKSAIACARIKLEVGLPVHQMPFGSCINGFRADSHDDLCSNEKHIEW